MKAVQTARMAVNSIELALGCPRILRNQDFFDSCDRTCPGTFLPFAFSSWKQEPTEPHPQLSSQQSMKLLDTNTRTEQIARAASQHSDATAPFSGQNHQLLLDLISRCKIQPRDYQKRIVLQAFQKLSQGAKSVLIESPTGSGKTVMGLATASLLQQQTGARVGWVAMRRNLLGQVQLENARREFGLEFETISMFEKSPPPVDLLVVDEAQHDAATSMANIHSQIQPRWTLGLSATPFRTDRIKLCFEHIIRDAGISSLIQDGYLSPYVHYTIPEHSPKWIANLLANAPEKWGKSLVFFHQRHECEELRSKLDEAGIRAEVVTSTSNRDRQLEAFDADQVSVLINMAILTEGFDCPTLKTVFCRPSGRGCTIQMAGRVLRKHDDFPAKQIVQCRKTKWPMHRTAMPAEQYLWSEGNWRSIRANHQLEKMTHIARNRIARAEVNLPKLVSIHRSRRATAWYSSIDD